MSDVIKKSKFNHGDGQAAAQTANKTSRLLRIRRVIKQTISRRQYIPEQLARYTAELEEKFASLSHAYAALAKSEARFRSIVDECVSPWVQRWRYLRHWAWAGDRQASSRTA